MSVFIQSGDVLCELIGHTRLINCAIMMENFVTQSRDVFDVVITGSSDQTVRVKYFDRLETSLACVEVSSARLMSKCCVRGTWSAK